MFTAFGISNAMLMLTGRHAHIPSPQVMRNKPFKNDTIICTPLP
jgi:hypothetical protein